MSLARGCRPEVSPSILALEFVEADDVAEGAGACCDDAVFWFRPSWRSDALKAVEDWVVRPGSTEVGGGTDGFLRVSACTGTDGLECLDSTGTFVTSGELDFFVLGSETEA